VVTVRERRPPLQAGVGRGRGDVFVLNIRVGGYNPELLHCHAWSSALCQLWRGDVWRWASGPHTSAGRSRSPILLAAAPPRRPFRRRAPIVLPPSPPPPRLWSCRPCCGRALIVSNSARLGRQGGRLAGSGLPRLLHDVDPLNRAAIAASSGGLDTGCFSPFRCSATLLISAAAAKWRRMAGRRGTLRTAVLRSRCQYWPSAGARGRSLSSLPRTCAQPSHFSRKISGLAAPGPTRLPAPPSALVGEERVLRAVRAWRAGKEGRAGRAQLV